MNKHTSSDEPGMGKFIAHYWRYHQHYTEDCDTLEEAKSFLDYGEDQGELTTELIETPDGVIDGDELHPILGKRPKGCRAPKPVESLNLEGVE